MLKYPSSFSSSHSDLMNLSYAPYRLQFKHPFGTAHGIRTGTDAVFVRLEDGDAAGYGEATLPPYLIDTQISVIQELKRIDHTLLFKQFSGYPSQLNELFPQTLSEPCRAALSTAFYDLKSRKLNRPIETLIQTAGLPKASKLAMVTLGHSELDLIEFKLSQLPNSNILKVKLGTDQDRDTIKRVIELDCRELLLDANQGWTEISQVMDMIELAGEDRITGIEQPFGKNRWDLHEALSQRTRVPIFGDESIQGTDDLIRAKGVFGGVNIKMMKCGGIDRVAEIIFKARELHLQIMLGCMSESSLGCGAMAQLAQYADLIDLDGPWLISNDPFQGLVWDGHGLRCLGMAGLGVDLIDPTYLSWITIGA